MERTFAWLHNLRRPRIRYERDSELHMAFMLLGCAVVCQRKLTGGEDSRRWGPHERPSASLLAQ